MSAVTNGVMNEVDAVCVCVLLSQVPDNEKNLLGQPVLFQGVYVQSAE
jgi:hypothetical protein